MAVLMLGLPDRSALAQGLDPQKALTQYVHDVWRKKEGLPHSAVYAILQTRDGYLWLGTGGGLVRFDGVHFDVFDKRTEEAFTRNRITALAEADDGTLWIGSEGGLLCYRDGTFTRYAGEAGLTSENISDIVIDGAGDVWVATFGNGVGRFDGEQFSMYTEADGLPHNTVWATLRDAQGRIWVGTNNGAAHIDGDVVTVVQPPKELTNRFVEALALRADGTVWIGSRGGVGYYRDGAWQRVRLSDGQRTPGGLRALYEDRHGTLWGGGRGGLARLVGGRIEQITAEDDLSDNNVHAIYQDREGNLWVGTVNGLNRFRDGWFTNYGEKGGLPAPWALAVRELRDGRLVVSSGRMLMQYRDGRFEPWEAASYKSVVHAIAEDQEGGLWLGGRCSGAWRLHEGTVAAYGVQQRSIPLCVTAIAPSRDGGVWVGIDGRNTGLYRIQRGQAAPETLPREAHVVNDLIETATGTLWLAMWRGLGRRDPGGSFTFFTPDDGLADDVVMTLYLEEDGTLWAGTDGGGVNRIRDGEITTVSSRHGLCDDALNALVDDGAGNLWMSGSRGISRVSLAALHAVADGRAAHLDCTLFDESDGLLRAQGLTGRPAAWRASDGRLWFATPGGVAVVDPQNEYRNPLPPPVAIKQMVVDGLPVDTTRQMVLPPGSQDFEFHYAGLSFVASEKVAFRYRLEGRDDDWVEAGSRRTAFFTDLDPGAYVFRVIAANNDGLWNEQGAAQVFVLKPYFWQTSWFFALCALGLVALGAGIYGLRVRQLKQRERELTALVAERTDSLRHEKEKTETLYLQLEADHARQKQELEEARALQLAMLPEHPPALDDLDIAVFMRTATEVGGDYYDFSLDLSGTLTVAVGDATGHGMKAGLVVATTKSYFQSLAAEESLGIVRQISRGLKEMKLRGMYMSLSLLKLRQDEATLMAAGMPPALLYRSDTDTVEQIVLKGMPLGSFPDFPYQQHAFTLQPGDLLLMMSDGLPELFNPEHEMLGDEPIIERVRQTASGSSKQVIERLAQLAASWTDGEPQNDDITLVVIKRK